MQSIDAKYGEPLSIYLLFIFNKLSELSMDKCPNPRWRTHPTVEESLQRSSCPNAGRMWVDMEPIGACFFLFVRFELTYFSTMKHDNHD